MATPRLYAARRPAALAGLVINDGETKECTAFTFSGLTPTGEVDNTGRALWNMAVSAVEDEIVKLLLEAV